MPEQYGLFRWMKCTSCFGQFISTKLYPWEACFMLEIPGGIKGALFLTYHLCNKCYDRQLDIIDVGRSVISGDKKFEKGMLNGWIYTR